METVRLPETGGENGLSDLEEIKSYILRLDRRLSLLLDNIGAENLSPELRERVYTEMPSDIGDIKREIIETAYQIKDVSDRIELRLANEYVAKSQIGEYTENAIQNITLDGKGITQYFDEINVLSGRMDGAESSIEEEIDRADAIQTEVSKLSAYIRTGKLDTGIYGIEIGNFSDGTNAPYKVRLSENRLSFFVGNDEAAYFSDNSMYISRACVPITLSVGGSVIKNDRGLTFTAAGNAAS